MKIGPLENFLLYGSNIKCINSLGPIFLKINMVYLLPTVLKLHVAISIVPYGNSYSLPKPRGYIPVVICNDCYPRQEEVGCKGRGNHRDSHAVSVQVTAQ